MGVACYAMCVVCIHVLSDVRVMHTYSKARRWGFDMMELNQWYSNENTERTFAFVHGATQEETRPGMTPDCYIKAAQ